MNSLNRLAHMRRLLVTSKRTWLRSFWRMDIHPTVEMSLSAQFDKTYPAGIHIGPETYIAFEVKILAHDMSRNVRRHTKIGERCFIGGRAIILPGVEIGDSCIIGAGAVVTKSVPSGCVAVGNPARIVKRGVNLLSYGRYESAKVATIDEYS